jgi:hypothetical protein
VSGLPASAQEAVRQGVGAVLGLPEPVREPEPEELAAVLAARLRAEPWHRSHQVVAE